MPTIGPLYAGVGVVANPVEPTSNSWAYVPPHILPGGAKTSAGKVTFMPSSLITMISVKGVVAAELDFRLELESKVKGQRKSQSPKITEASAVGDDTDVRPDVVEVIDIFPKKRLVVVTVTLGMVTAKGYVIPAAAIPTQSTAEYSREQSLFSSKPHPSVA